MVRVCSRRIGAWLARDVGLSRRLARGGVWGRCHVASTSKLVLSPAQRPQLLLRTAQLQEGPAPSFQRRSGYLIVYLAPRRLPAVLVAQLLCARGAADHRNSPLPITENPQGQFERHEGSGRYFDDNSATPRTGGAGASAGQRPELLAMEGDMGCDHVEVDGVSMRVLTTEVGPCGCPRWPSRPQCGRSTTTPRQPRPAALHRPAAPQPLPPSLRSVDRAPVTTHQVRTC